ncbi:hypothetical protein D7252_12110 [Microbacterium sp. CGR2]|nr:hypothetical protein D7252_12110 [Microbacterium sp. CGR2]
MPRSKRWRRSTSTSSASRSAVLGTPSTASSKARGCTTERPHDLATARRRRPDASGVRRAACGVRRAACGVRRAACRSTRRILRSRLRGARPSHPAHRSTRDGCQP